MFSQASVILFTGGGGVPQTPPGRHPPAQRMLGYNPAPAAAAADGTHLTGMLKIFYLYCLLPFYFAGNTAIAQLQEAYSGELTCISL